jgi:cell division protein FtsI/penicillin-binding protein 2
LEIDKPLATGSLMKPLIAATTPRDRQVVCGPGRCWLPRGHGRIGIVDAIAFSCNEWFGGVDSRATPAALARGYMDVIHVDVVREGMRKAAAEGTARLLGVQTLAKTGTAPCSHSAHGPGDGLVIALWPEAHSKYVLLVRVHGTTGSVAAVKAGSLLRVVRDGR